MALTFLTNVPALAASRYLSLHTKHLTANLERLSTGLRINRAADDAAGLAISTSLNSELVNLTAAVQNTNNGISLISVADGALDAIGNILTRMAEVAEQSTNGSLQQLNRSPLQAEWLALSSEITRISRTTAFNGIHLLISNTGLVHQFGIQVGTTGASNSQVIVGGVIATIETLHLGTNTDQLSFSVIDQTIPQSVDAAESALEAAIAGIREVANLRGQLGASASRLDHALSNAQLRRLNTSDAVSNIRDLDYAREATDYAKNLVLQQAASAILAQANVTPSRALALLS